MEKQSEQRGLDGRIFKTPPLYAGAAGEVRCEVTTYCNNGALALQLVGKIDERMLPPGIDPFQEPFATVTVNLALSDTLADNEQFVDTNNLRGITTWLEANGIASPTGYGAQSGYHVYPVYRFNLSENELALVRHRKAEIGIARSQKSAPSIKR